MIEVDGDQVKGMLQEIDDLIIKWVKERGPDMTMTMVSIHNVLVEADRRVRGGHYDEHEVL